MDHYSCAKSLIGCLLIISIMQGSYQSHMSIKWKDCPGNANYKYIVWNETDLENIVVPGSATFSMNINITSSLDNLSGKETLEQEVNGTYVSIPCKGAYSGVLIGSCELVNLCEEWAAGDCRPPITSISSDCKCPLKKGSYRIEPFTVNLSFKFAVGNYRWKFEMQQNGANIGCTLAEVSVTSDN